MATRTGRVVKKNSMLDDYDDFSDPDYHVEDAGDEAEGSLSSKGSSFHVRPTAPIVAPRPRMPLVRPALGQAPRIIRIPGAAGSAPRCIVIPSPGQRPIQPKSALVWRDGQLISIPGAGAVSRGRGSTPRAATPRRTRTPRGRGRGRGRSERVKEDDEFSPTPSRRRSRTPKTPKQPIFIEKEDIIDFKELPRPNPRPDVEIDPNEEPNNLSKGDPFDSDSYLHMNTLSEAASKNSKLAAEYNCNITLEEIGRFNKFSGYKLFQLVSKKQYQDMTANNPSIDDEANTSVTKRIQENWNALPLKERETWKSKAKKLERMAATAIRRNANSEEKRLKDKNRLEVQLQRSRVSDFTLLDIAGHLKMLEMTTKELADKLYQSKAPVITESAESALLDIFISSTIPLISLCRSIDFFEDTPSDETVLTGLNSLTFLNELRRRYEDLKQEINELSERKRELEAEESMFTQMLGQVGMEGHLVDAEGFPRNDVDVHQIRTARNRLKCLNTDHKEVMTRLEDLLMQLHATAKKLPSEETATSVISQLNIEPPKIPFLKITRVDSDTPAATAGFEVNDLITQFGRLTKARFSALKDLSAYVSSLAAGEFVTVHVLRGFENQSMELRLQKPGEGPLGLSFVVYTA
ncbi:26S proteasome non-ATPase regulatory subunit 9 [Cichlidogyrus casuarinus]|uniref:26S proteasome non-ATPase regulatory subunit 9 n=1 Tax=Cichlidogyrus casuarinus TaxID=1844966 RepID=A0ABD2QNF3_9PLAT